MIGRVALLVTFKKAKPKPQSLSRSHIRDLWAINKMKALLTVLSCLATTLTLYGQPKLLSGLEYQTVRNPPPDNSSIIPSPHYIVTGKSSILLEKKLRKVQKVSIEEKPDLTTVTYTNGSYVFVVFKWPGWKQNNQLHITTVKSGTIKSD